MCHYKSQLGEVCQIVSLTALQWQKRLHHFPKLEALKQKLGFYDRMHEMLVLS